MIRFLLAFLMFAFFNAYAQEPAEVKKIRAVYNAAIKNESKNGKVTINMNRNFCAVGATQKKVEILLNENKKPLFVRESFNRAALKFYREYLWDENGKPEFWFRADDDYSGNKIQERFYFLEKNEIHSIPKEAKNNFSGMDALKGDFSYYAELVKKIKNYEEDKTDAPDLSSRFIKPEEAKDNPEIAAIKKKEKDLRKLISQAKEEIHLNNKVEIAVYDKGELRKKLKFYFCPPDTCPDAEEFGNLDLVEVEDFNTDPKESDMGESFIFDEKENLQKSYSWENHEGTEGVLYFLAQDKIYCLGDVRLMKNNGEMVQTQIPCNSENAKEGMFLGGANYSAEGDSKKLLEIFSFISILSFN